MRKKRLTPFCNRGIKVDQCLAWEWELETVDKTVVIRASRRDSLPGIEGLCISGMKWNSFPAALVYKNLDLKIRNSLGANNGSLLVSRSL